MSVLRFHARPLTFTLARPNYVPNMKKRLIHNEMICGNKPVEEPLNIKREISRFQNNPLDPLIEFIGVSELIKHGDIGRYYRSFEFYAFSLERVLRAISVGRRFQRQVQPYYGCSQKFSPLQKNISRQYREQRKFFELDFTNYLIHARILMDRIVGISRRFLEGSRLPSFSSFNSHKKFLRNNAKAFASAHSEYFDKIVKNTEWFDMPIKAIRDKMLIHTPPEHFLFLGYPNDHDLEMIFILRKEREHEQFGNSRWVSFSVRRIARDIEEFLIWYNSYALNAICDANGVKKKGG